MRTIFKRKINNCALAQHNRAIVNFFTCKSSSSRYAVPGRDPHATRYKSAFVVEDKGSADWSRMARSCELRLAPRGQGVLVNGDLHLAISVDYAETEHSTREGLTTHLFRALRETSQSKGPQS